MRNEMLVLKGRASAANGETPQVTFDFPESFQEAADMWGPDVAEKVFAGAVRDLVLRTAKSRLTAGRSVEEIQNEMAGWTPGARAPRKPRKARDPSAAMLRAVSKMSAEEQAMYYEEIAKRLASDPRFASDPAGA